MSDKTIGELPAAQSVSDTTLIPVENQGVAQKMSGKQFREFGERAVQRYVETAQNAANTAQNANVTAQNAAARAEAARDDIIDDAEQAARDAAAASQSAQAASGSATQAADSAALSRSWAEGGTGIRVGEDTDNAEYWANVAEAAAERVTAPPVVGVYNVILQDRGTGEKYALRVVNRHIQLLGVADDLNAMELTLIDDVTGAKSWVYVENGRLGVEEI